MRPPNLVRIALFVACVLAGCAGVVQNLEQEIRTDGLAGLHVKIRDDVGRPVESATVKLTHTSGRERSIESTTDDRGYAFFNDMQPGPYAIGIGLPPRHLYDPV